MGLLERSHSYKDKTARGLPSSHGLFAYPVLMAADILLYSADVVPVGKDQKQHLEMTRDIAIKFNETYGATLKVPEPLIREEVATVVGLDGQKMSKSYDNTIEIFGPEKLIRKKVMSIVTDSTPVEAPKDPTNSTILQLYRLFASPEQIAAMEDAFRAGGTGYGEFKKQLFEAIWNTFAPMRARRAELQADRIMWRRYSSWSAPRYRVRKNPRKGSNGGRTSGSIRRKSSGVVNSDSSDKTAGHNDGPLKFATRTQMKTIFSELLRTTAVFLRGAEFEQPVQARAFAYPN